MLVLVTSLFLNETLKTSGITQEFACNAVDDNSVTLQHDKDIQHLTVVVETLSAILVNGVIKDSGSKSKQIYLNVSHNISDFAPGKISVEFKCNNAGSVFITFFDNTFLLPNQKLTPAGDAVTYFMVPICKPLGNFTIETDSLVYASFETGRPSKDDAKSFNNAADNKTLIIDGSTLTKPGYLFIQLTINKNGFIKVFQHTHEKIQQNIEHQPNLSGMNGCQINYLVDIKKTQNIVIAGTEDDGKTVSLLPSIYVKKDYDEKNICSHTNNKNFTENQGIFDLYNVNYPEFYENDTTIDIAFKMGLNTHFLPKFHTTVIPPYFQLGLSIFVNGDGHYLYPGYKMNVNYPASNATVDTVIIYKRADQLFYTNSSLERNSTKPSNYVAEFESDSIRDVVMKFGYNSPELNQGHVNQTSNKTISGFVKFDQASAHDLGDLFYVRLQAKNATKGGSGIVRAEHSYIIQDRVQYRFARITDQNENRFFASYKPTATKGFELQIHNVRGKFLNIYVSYTDYLPTSQSSDFKHVCNTSEKVCNFIIDTLDEKKYQDFIFISFETDDQFEFIGGPKDYVLKELKEFDETTDQLNLKGSNLSILKSEFIFIPFYYDHLKQQKENDYALITVDLDTAAVNKIERKDIDVLVHIGDAPDPELAPKYTISLKNGIAYKQDGTVEARKHRIITVPRNNEIFITIVCSGADCSQNIGVINFKIKVNSMNAIEEQQPGGSQYFNMRDDGHSQSGFFYTKDEESALLRIHAPQQISNIWQKDVNCSEVGFEAFICVGTMLSKEEEENHSFTGSCWYRNYLVEHNHTTNYIIIDLDSSKASVAAGTVFVKIRPHLDKVTGRKDFVSNCATRVELYKNEQISHFNEVYHTTLYGGTGINQGVHLMSDIPMIVGHKGTNGTDAVYGDRLIFKFNAEQDMELCISDNDAVPYPHPTGQNDSNCNLYLSAAPEKTGDLTLAFQNYLNRKGFGNTMSSTRIYFTAWAATNVVKGAGFNVNITILPQAYINTKGFSDFYFAAQSLYGNDHYVNFAINMLNVSSQEQRQMTLVVGPNCNNAKCREVIPSSFYDRNIITYVAYDHKIPSHRHYIKQSYQPGVQMFHLSSLNETNQEIKDYSMLYVTFEYRHHHKLDQTNVKSNLSYMLYFLEYYDGKNQLAYQTKTDVVKNAFNSFPIDYFHANLPYNPSEIVLYPCKGKPSILLDHITPASHPGGKDFQIQVSGPWGRPISYRYTNDTMTTTTSFFSIFDEAIFDYEKGHFTSNKSIMEYQLFVGSQAEMNTPGNQGQITVATFSSKGNGKITVRIAPARQPHQTTNVSEVDYLLYVIPYQGSFDHENDYTPYTSCGAKNAGYTVYKDEIGLERVIYDPAAVEKDGYVELTSNQPLWKEGAKKSQILYVTVLVGQVAYQGVLVGDNTMSVAGLMGITLTITVIIAAVLLVLFWFLFIRVKKMKQQGYKPVVS